MEVFLDMLLTIHLADWRFSDNMVPVVEAIMLDIMAKCSNDEGQIVEVIILSVFHKILSLEDEANVLSNI